MGSRHQHLNRRSVRARTLAMNECPLAAVPHGAVNNAGSPQLFNARPFVDMSAEEHKRLFTADEAKQVFTAGVEFSHDFVQNAPGRRVHHEDGI